MLKTTALRGGEATPLPPFCRTAIWRRPETSLGMSQDAQAGPLEVCPVSWLPVHESRSTEYPAPLRPLCRESRVVCVYMSETLYRVSSMIYVKKL